MSEFWEENFVDKQEIWGFEPAKSAELTKNLFIEKSINNILIPRIGYGRNAQIFKENGINVTGIEISKTAIALAQKHYATNINIFHGSVTEMPFDNKEYDGIFCYALIHLLNKEERTKLISDCYNQLTKNGYMVFTAITKNAPNFGKG
ncbi:class I SAM-dependent methyltransferase [Maribacter litoralis]|jgi:SAM-dependent methyltransferase|uniref:class I SAM-dependent methyltransferase n=1 Tax=Maribacter litoralis TaxID=2059726 RepID=UPI001FC9C274|nr:class I SAM-dependent methyltransferase [Maribacter litoralis]|tara:strand:- start:1022 stop:1465 length:444 start_codon:yes stop_codon:yes gene_type:complete